MTVDGDASEDSADEAHGHVSDEELAEHAHANHLEAAMDYVTEAKRRAEGQSIEAAQVARLKLALRGARLAFYATSDAERTIGVADAVGHLRIVVDAVDEESVTHPVRHALQLYVGYEDGDT